MYIYRYIYIYAYTYARRGPRRLKVCVVRLVTDPPHSEMADAAARKYSKSPAPIGASSALAFTRYCFTSRLMCTDQSSLIAPLHNTIARLLDNVRLPLRTLVFMPYAIQYW